MKKPHVLNRPMFNKGGTSAYGRGITSNLVTEEQRQRFNYGGRVRAVEGLSVGDSWSQGLGKDPWGWQRWDPNLFLTPQQIEEKDETQYGTNQERRLGVMGLEDPIDYQGDVIEKAEFIDTKDRGDVMTASDWLDLSEPTPEQKRMTKGEQLTGLAAGALDVFSQPTIAKGMKAASPHLLNLGKTATADQKARDKAILQGKVLSKVYTDRATAKGKADIDTLQWKADLLQKGTPSEKYMAHIAGEELKPKVIRDAIYRASGSKIIPKMMPGTTEAADKERADPKNEGKIYIQDQQTFILKNGEFEIIDIDSIFETLKP